MTDYEPVGAVEPNAPPLVDAVPEVPEERPSDTAIMVGCGIVGWTVAGPFLAILTALGGKYAADRQGPWGEGVRSVGRIASVAGKKAREEHFLCKLKAAIRSLFGKKEGCNCKNCINNQQGSTCK